MVSRLLPVLSLLVLLMALPSPARAQQNLAAQQRAAEAVEAGRYGDALSILRTILSADTQNVEGLVLRGRAYAGRGEYALAIADFERALQIDPDNAAAQRGLEQARQRYRGALGSNLESLRNLVTAYPDNLQYRIQYADALYDAGLYREAADQFAAYLDRTQGTPDVVRRYLIAIANYEGDNQRGEDVAERYLRFYPTDADLHMRLGYFHLWQGEQAAARAAFQQALRLDPENREAQRGLDQLRNPQAVVQASTYPIDVLTRELEQNPDQDAKRFDLIDLLIEARRYFEAKQQLDRLAGAYGDDPRWQTRNRTVTRRLAQTSSPASGGSTFIVDRLYQELERNPNQDDKRFQLVQALLQYERYAEAFDQLQILEPEYGQTRRWLSFFVETDQGLTESDSTPLYPVDRYVYLVRANPDDQALRYGLVDALIEAQRFAEAYDVLTDPEYAQPADERYRTRLRMLTETRLRLAQERIDELEARLAANPADEQALRQLIPQYLFVDRVDDALAGYAQLVQRHPADDSLRFDYAEALWAYGAPEQALTETDVLLQRAPENRQYQRLYVLSALAADQLDEQAETYLQAILDRRPTDVSVVLDLASLRLAEGDVERADELLRRAMTAASPAYEKRIQTLDELVERAQLRVAEADQFELLNEARRLAEAGRYRDAIAAYETYFEANGKRTRTELKEVAQLYSAAGDFVTALSILRALQDEYFEYEVEKAIAKNQIYREDYAGAIETLEALLALNPSDYEARLLMANAYRELGFYARADRVYTEADSFTVASRLVDEGRTLIALSSTGGVAQSGPGRGFDYAGLVVPTSAAVVGRGGGTRYDRWAQGLQTQVTLPLSAVLTAGVTSHFISGSRRLVQNAETVRGRLNQVFGGGYIDLTDPVRSDVASYTNRLQAEVGLFDYEGGRTTPYAHLRYWRQEPGRYTGSIGLRSTEGAIELWSPAGGEFELRLTQIDVRMQTRSILPDSLLKFSGVFAFNIVRDSFGNTATTTDTNYGTNIRLDVGYRIVSHTYLGLDYYQIDYRTTTDIYFSPNRYESFDLYLEYEREAFPKWYWRLRGSIGLVARSNGFVSRRLETELIYRIARKLSFTATGAVGTSTRSLGGTTTTDLDRYSIVTMSAALYWTL